MKLNIETNPHNGGLYSYFTHNGSEFVADLCEIEFFGSECMIFPAHDKKVTSWAELYCKRGIPVTEKQLTACVEEFIESY